MLLLIVNLGIMKEEEFYLDFSIFCPALTVVIVVVLRLLPHTAVRLCRACSKAENFRKISCGNLAVGSGSGLARVHSKGCPAAQFKVSGLLS